MARALSRGGESTNLNYRMRVLESLVLRSYRPRAICTFEPSVG